MRSTGTVTFTGPLYLDFAINEAMYSNFQASSPSEQKQNVQICFFFYKVFTTDVNQNPCSLLSIFMGHLLFIVLKCGSCGTELRQEVLM